MFPFLADEFRISANIIVLYQQLDDLSIPRIQEATPLATMLAQENITFFLAAAADYGVSPHKRFFMLDLWNGNSRPRVIESLAELARVAAVKGFRVPLKVSVLPLDQVPHGLSPADMKQLEEQLSRTRMKDTGVARKDAPGIFKRKLAYLVSQKDFPDFERRWTRIQALIRGRAARAKFQSRVLNQAFRDRVARELRDTEESYVQSLDTCIRRYLTPLRTGSWNKKLILDKAVIKDLFSDIEIIYNVNTVLLKMINDAMKNWGPATQLGSIFVYIMNFLKVYTNYVSVADTQLATYDSLLKTNKLFPKFVESVRLGTDLDPNAGEKASSAPKTGDSALAPKTEAESKPVLDIPGYLIMPIQRVPRYFMLLERLLKHTWKDHQDYADLEKSVNGLQAVAQSLNQKKRDFENIRSVTAFQGSIIGCPPIAMPTRSLVKQFEVVDEKKKEDWFLALFNDSLLVAKSEKKKGVTTHKFKGHYKLVTVEVSIQDAVLEIKSEGNTVVKLASNPESLDFAQQLPLVKAAYSDKVKKIGQMDDGSELPEHLVNELAAEHEAQSITPEELLKKREAEKRLLRSQVAEDMKVLKTFTMRSSDLAGTPPSSNPATPTASPSPSSTNLAARPAGRRASASPTPANRITVSSATSPGTPQTSSTKLPLNASTGSTGSNGGRYGTPPPRPSLGSSNASNTASPVLRSTASLMKIKAYVEDQISVLDTQIEADDEKNEEYQNLARNLNQELAEIDQQIEEVKEFLTPEMREAVNQQESAMRLEVMEEKKNVKPSNGKKKGRRSFFSFFSSNSSVNSDAAAKEKPKGSKSGTSTPTTADTPPSSVKVPKARHSSKVDPSKIDSPGEGTAPASPITKRQKSASVSGPHPHINSSATASTKV